MTVYADGKGTERKAANLFGDDSDSVGYYDTGDAETTVENGTDGWAANGLVDARNTTSYADVCTGQFTTNDVSAFEGAGNFLFMAFAFRGNKLPEWGAAGTWVQKPTADENNYKLAVLKSDAQNSRNEYFRLFYTNDSTDVYGYFANPHVWKDTVATAEDIAFNADKNTLSVFGVENY
jgi:hypothetical protein